MVVGDHPRSRGVYRILSLAFARVTGSSPLARGLHSEFRLRVARLRIIPARAGFTRRRRGDGYSIEDHPRSRGVYRDLAVPGLRPRRIIPARAGFTRDSCPISRTWGDHPRSRGVYTTPRPCGRGTGGSSPLARGLQRPGRRVVDLARIIPARAGFTHRRKWRREDPQDHPRSRGVYAASGQASSVAPGSSPLARGLPVIVPENMSGSRIIPARAGFTYTSLNATVGAGDHPRSRGVYKVLVQRPLDAAGSSPLARGLPCRAFRLWGHIGIIPARAGFTGR